jgi:hypothetical protein
MKLKNIRVILILLGLTLFGLSGNAEADWQKTKWGMTIKEIRAVMTRQIKEIPENLKDKLTEGASYYSPNYTIGKHTFNVAFMFDDQERLKAVYLHYVGDNTMGCFVNIKDELKKKYGKPSDEKDDDLNQELKEGSCEKVAEWVTPDTLISVRYSMIVVNKTIHEFMTIGYQARVSESADKL